MRVRLVLGVLLLLFSCDLYMTSTVVENSNNDVENEEETSRSGQPSTEGEEIWILDTFISRVFEI